MRIISGTAPKALRLAGYAPPPEAHRSEQTVDGHQAVLGVERA